jgi:hypothetical protein
VGLASINILNHLLVLQMNVFNRMISYGAGGDSPKERDAPNGILVERKSFWLLSNNMRVAFIV